MIPPLVYFLCAATSLTCAVLLFRAYRGSHFRLLFWSAICFGALAMNNVLLFVDLIIVPQLDLLLWRNITGLVGVGTLLFGLIWDSQ